MLGLEHLMQNGILKESKRKLIIAFGLTGGLCFLFFLLAGMFSFSKSIENQLPAWFTNAMHADRESMMRGDALRSFAFIFSIFILLYFNVHKKTSAIGFFAFLTLMVVLDLAVVDGRYFTKADYQRKRDKASLTPAPSSETILRDKGIYRVLNLRGFYEAGTSNFHHSLGGYHGVRIKRYQELLDSCIFREQEQLISNAQQGKIDFSNFGVLNMLNTKYFLYGDNASDIILNSEANGNAWFVKEVVKVNSPNDELTKVAEINTKSIAVLDDSKFKVQDFKFDSLGYIKLIEAKPPYIKYESESSVNSLAVFSEIYYPKGWHALIDEKEVSILRVDYVLRALEVPAGKHKIEFKFEPKPYIIGNKITMASSWVLVLVVVGCLGWSLRKEDVTN
jgi:hypothetical protein